jgi:hypothetical protein
LLRENCDDARRRAGNVFLYARWTCSIGMRGRSPA